MKIRYAYIFILLFLLLSISPDIFSDNTPGSANSRPNGSGGFDFFDSEGNKLGFSSKDNNGDYIYYDANGSITGHIKYDGKTGRYNIFDGDNIRVGELSQDRHGGYRFSNTKEAAQTPMQMNIRRDYSYANPYGEGIGTMPLKVMKGVEGTGRSRTSVGLDRFSPGLDTASTNASKLNLTPLGGKSGLTTENSGSKGLSTKSQR